MPSEAGNGAAAPGGGGGGVLGAQQGRAGVAVGGRPQHRLYVWDGGRRGPSTAVPGIGVVGVSLINLRRKYKAG